MNDSNTELLFSILAGPVLGYTPLSDPRSDTIPSEKEPSSEVPPEVNPPQTNPPMQDPEIPVPEKLGLH